MGILEEGYGRIANLIQVEAADLTRHADRNTLIRADKDVGEGCGKECGFLHGVVVVGGEIHCILIQTGKQFSADGHEFRFGISWRGPCHISGIYLAKVTFGINKRMKQRPIPLRETYHCVIDCRVAMWIQLHRLSNNVGRFCPRSLLVHRVQDFAVAWFEAVDLRDSAGDDDGHGVGHIICLQRLCNRLLNGFLSETIDIGIY